MTDMTSATLGGREAIDAARIQAAREEEKARLARAAAYKKRWRADREAASPGLAAERRAKQAAYQRKWRAENRDKARAISRAAGAKYSAANPATKRQSGRDYQRRARQEICEFYGGKCVRCGFSDIRALQMDHIQGGGRKLRIKNEQNAQCRLKFIRENPEVARAVFQLLCANCNWIKRDEQYEYSDKARIRKAAGL